MGYRAKVPQRLGITPRTVARSSARFPALRLFHQARATAVPPAEYCLVTRTDLPRVRSYNSLIERTIR